jgi:hypothetical protein
VRLFYPAGQVHAAQVLTGLLSATLADLALAVDRGFPGGLGTLPIAACSRAPSAQPTDRVTW